MSSLVHNKCEYIIKVIASMFLFRFLNILRKARPIGWSAKLITTY